MSLTASKLDREHVPRLHLAVYLLLIVDEWIHRPAARLLHRLALHEVLDLLGRRVLLASTIGCHLLADDPLDPARADLLHLLRHLLQFVEVSPGSLHLSQLLCPLDLRQELSVGLVQLVLVILMKVFVWIINSVIDWLQEVALWGLEAAAQGDGLLRVKSIELKLGWLLARRERLVFSLRE